MKVNFEVSQSAQGYTFDLKKTDPKVIEKIIAKATVRPRVFQQIGPPPPAFPVYVKTKTKLTVPRYFMKQHFPELIKDCPLKLQMQGNDIDCRFKGKLRPEQVPICDAMLKALFMDGGGLINAPCGTGKTAMADYLITVLKKKALIIVHNEYLADQHVERLQQFTDCKIGIIRGKKIDVEGKDVVIGMLQSLSMKKFPKDLFKQFGTVIVDECHHIAARVFSKALFKISTQFMIGLSATPERKDGLSRVFHWFLGPVRYSKTIEREQSILVKMVRCHGVEPWYKEITNRMGKANVPTMLTKLGEYPDRTNFIVTQVTALSDEGRQVLVLSDRRAHVEEMAALLKDRGIDAGTMMGATKKKDKELRKLSLNCQVIVGTYKMVAEGFDCNRLDTLVMATPIKDITQAIGRILRKKRYERQPLVIDIEDRFSSFRGQASFRRGIYKKQKKPDCVVELYDKTLGTDPDDLGKFTGLLGKRCNAKKDTYQRLGNKCLI
jgi:superfamily II DNA or RNA helicase